MTDTCTARPRLSTFKAHRPNTGDVLYAFAWTSGLVYQPECIGALVNGNGDRIRGRRWGNLPPRVAAPLPPTVTSETYSADGWGELSEDFGGCAE